MWGNGRQRTVRRGTTLTRRLRNLAVVLLIGGAQPAFAQDVIDVKTVPQAQRLAMVAIGSGQLELALQLADAILAAHPEDSFAHMVRATALLQSGQPREAAPEARRAYRYAETPRQKYEAARIAALAATRQQRFLPAQIWMRRAIQAAPLPTDRARASQEFRAVRQAARLGIDLGFSVVPSSNVNGGSGDRLNVIEGVDLVGVLSGAALALPGTVTSGQAKLRYRLAQNQRSITQLTGALEVTRVALTDEARTLAPTTSNKDFSATYAEIGLTHARMMGPDGAVLRLNADLGRVWRAGDISHNVARGTLSYGWNLSQTTRLTLSGTAQQEFSFADGRDDVRTGAVAATFHHSLANKDTLSLQLGRSAALSDNAQAERTASTLSLGYTRHKPLGPVTLSGRLTLSEAHYPDYMVGLITVPNGRRDQRIAAQVNFGITPLEYMGFLPTVTLSAEKTDSNVSRFTTDEMSVSVGFRSAF